MKLNSCILCVAAILFPLTAMGACIGESKIQCKAEIAKAIHVMPRKKPGADDVDVNGKSLIPDYDIEGRISGGGIVDYDITEENGKVTMLMARLAHDPGLAKTQRGYRSTGLYKSFQLAFGDACPEKEMDFYRFFENEIKPASPEITSFEDAGANIRKHVKRQSPEKMVCREHGFIYVSSITYDPADASEYNPDGEYGGATIIFK